MEDFEIDIDREEKIGEELSEMCNLSEAIENQGIEKGIEKGIERGIEKGIEAFILDNLEERVEKKRIIEKLTRRFSLSEEKAKEYFRRFGEK